MKLLALILMYAMSDLTAMSSDTVILVHGLGRSTWSMKPIEWNLKRAGYHVVNVGYPSRRGVTSAEACLQRAIETNATAAGSIHFVTHSFGGILVRKYLTDHPLPNLGRVVMLAPPNHGSEVADSLRKTAIGRWILGPIGERLGTGAGDLPARLGAVRFPLGVVAADQSIDPWFSHLFIQANDGKVSV